MALAGRSHRAGDCAAVGRFAGGGTQAAGAHQSAPAPATGEIGGEIPSQSPLGGYSSLAASTTIIVSWGGVLIGVSLAWLFLVGYAERRLEGNRLWLMGATYDAGAVIAHRVWVFNPTGSTLEVDVMPHCGCTVVEEPKRRMLPLTGFPLTVQVDTTGKRAGTQEQRVELIVRDGRYSWRELITVRFTVQDASLSR